MSIGHLSGGWRVGRKTQRMTYLCGGYNLIIKTGHMKLVQMYVNNMERFQMSCLKGPDLLKQKCSMHFKRIHCADI